MSEPVLVGQELVAGYIPEVNILNGCNLVVHEGEFVGIIGPNGAGKSTYLKAVLGLCNVRSGSVTLAGEDITGMKAHQLVSKGVGYVPQTKNVFPSLTVTENLEMGCFLKPSLFKSRYEYVTGLFPTPRAQGPTRRSPVRWRASDGGDGPSPDDGAQGAPPRRQIGRSVADHADEVFLNCKAIRGTTGVSI
ncbi:MAG: ATP-binding cassette domain-containing protein [Ilumatobacteraceae bacterium]